MSAALDLGLFVPFEWICQLFDKRHRDRLAVYPITVWPACPGHQECSKEHVKHREMHCKVLVNRFFISSMMPVVKLRRGENIAPIAHVKAQVCVDKDRIERHKPDVRIERIAIESHDEGWNVNGAPGYGKVKDMQAVPSHPVHYFGRVVYCVKLPEPRYLMECTVNPVLDDIREEHNLNELQYRGLRADGSLERGDFGP